MVTFYLETKMGQFTPETVVFKEAIDQYNWLYPASHIDVIHFDQSDWEARSRFRVEHGPLYIFRERRLIPQHQALEKESGVYYLAKREYVIGLLAA